MKQHERARRTAERRVHPSDVIVFFTIPLIFVAELNMLRWTKVMCCCCRQQGGIRRLWAMGKKRNASLSAIILISRIHCFNTSNVQIQSSGSSGTRLSAQWPRRQRLPRVPRYRHTYDKRDYEFFPIKTTCCRSQLPWLPTCSSEGVVDAGSRDWYVNWSKRKFVQDCPTVSGGSCGGLAQSYDYDEPLFGSRVPVVRPNSMDVTECL